MADESSKVRHSHSTQTDVAKLAGVSRGLVSLVLRGEGRVSTETREKILEAAAKLHYAPNLAAAQLATRRSQFIFLLTPCFSNPFLQSIAQGVQEAAKEYGLKVLLMDSGETIESEKAALKLVEQFRPVGVLMSWPLSSTEVLSEYSSQTPICVLTQKRGCPGVGSVYMDEDAAAKEVLEYLRVKEYQRLVFMYPDPQAGEYVNPLRAEALKKAALNAQMDYCEIMYEGAKDKSVISELNAFPPQPKTALIAYNDSLAFRIIRLLDRLGHSDMGCQIGVVGYDNTWLSAQSEYLLTSVSQEPVKMGKVAISMLLAGTDSIADVAIEPRLICRESC